MKSCFMFGHADCPDEILPKIENAIETHYSKHGVRLFYVGNRGSFDRLAAFAAKKVKLRYPDMKLFLVLAYHPAQRKPDLTDGFDGSYYPPLEGVPKQYAIIRTNHHMIDIADSMICYVRHIGNTRNLLEYAQRRNKKDGNPIQNLAL